MGKVRPASTIKEGASGEVAPLPPDHHRALCAIVDALRDENVVWALTGSASFALQGMPVAPKDIDIQTDEDGVYRIQELFRDQMTRPVTFSRSDQIQSHFGALRLGDIEVELMGAVQ